MVSLIMRSMRLGRSVNKTFYTANYEGVVGEDPGRIEGDDLTKLLDETVTRLPEWNRGKRKLVLVLEGDLTLKQRGEIQTAIAQRYLQREGVQADYKLGYDILGMND